MHDGISFEQRGKPALVILTTPFETNARNLAKGLGLPDYCFATVEHPIGSRSLPELKGRAAAAYEQGLGILVR